MRKLLEAMQRVRALAAVGVDSRLSLSLDAERELMPFTVALARMRATQPVEGAPRPKGLDVDALWARWRSSGRTITGFSNRELRALCWERRAAEDEHFLTALESSGYVPTRLSFVRGLWHVHQYHWRIATATRLERLFAQAGAMEGHKPRWLRTALDTPGLFSERGAQVLGRALYAQISAVRTMFDVLGVSADGGLAQRALQVGRDEWLDILKQYAAQNHPTTATILSDGARVLLSAELTNAQDFREAVERLLGVLADSGDQYRRALQAWIVADTRLGHPRRRATSGNWVGISEPARLAALRLFAAKDIGRFFDILIGRQFDNQQRRPFWEQYINSPQFVDYAIACDPNDRKKLIAAWTEGTPDVARLDGAPDNHSAFIMRFRTARYDLLIAEMSRANNAMYLFNTEAFEQRVGSIDRARFVFTALKNKALAVDHWSHMSGWEQRFAGRLREYGIYRGTR